MKSKSDLTTCTQGGRAVVLINGKQSFFSPSDRTCRWVWLNGVNAVGGVRLSRIMTRNNGRKERFRTNRRPVSSVHIFRLQFNSEQLQWIKENSHERERLFPHEPFYFQASGIRVSPMATLVFTDKDFDMKSLLSHGNGAGAEQDQVVQKKKKTKQKS